MRLLLRLADAAGTIGDLRVEAADDLRVGELADALAAHCGATSGSTLAARWPASAATGPVPREALVAGQGPRSGSTIELVPAPDAVEDPAAPSPVTVVAGDGRARRLDYGANRLGPLLVEVGDSVEVHVVDASPATVNGERLLGRRRLAHGDLLGLSSELWTLEIHEALTPPPAGARGSSTAELLDATRRRRPRPSSCRRHPRGPASRASPCCPPWFRC